MRQHREEFWDTEEYHGAFRGQAVIGLVGIIGLGPILAAYFITLWSVPAFRFFPLALACSFFLYWRAWRESPRPPKPGSIWLSLSCAPIVLLLLAMAVVKGRPALGYFASLIGVSLFLWSIGSRRLFRRSFPALLLALFCSMPVLHHFQQSLRRFCEVTLEIGAVGLGLMGVPSAVEVDSLRLPSAQVIHLQPSIVAGVFFSSLVLAAFYSFFRRRPTIFCPIVVITTWLAAPLAIGLILTLCGSITYYGKIAALTWSTPWIGLGMGIGVFILGTWLPDSWLQRRYGDPLILSNQPQKNTEPLMARFPFGITIKLISAALIALGLLQIFIIAKRFKAQQRTAIVSINISSHGILALGDDLPPSQVPVQKHIASE